MLEDAWRTFVRCAFTPSLTTIASPTYGSLAHIFRLKFAEDLRPGIGE
jgi:hypothetical protein